jgi:DNA-binding LacI/PurR family transcriptional regulator
MDTKPLLRDKITEALRSMAHERQSDRPVRIEPERALAERLEVSRLSLRAAIKNLVDEGLLIQRQGSGTYIVPRTRWEVVHLLVASDLKLKDPFYHEFIAALTRRLGHETMHLRTIYGDGDPAGCSDAPLIILGLEDSSVIARMKGRYRHIVAVQSYPDNLDITQVHFDDFRIGHDAARILVEYGHHSLVHLAGPDAYPSPAERQRGFLQSAENAGARVHVIPGKMNWQGGDQLGRKVLKLLQKADPPTAVFAANDWMALGLMHQLRDNGVRIPDDLSLIGCDDIHLAVEIDPALATFRWDMDYLITELFTILDAQMTADDASAAKRVLLPAEFVPRASLKTRHE